MLRLLSNIRPSKPALPPGINLLALRYTRTKVVDKEFLHKLKSYKEERQQRELLGSQENINEDIADFQDLIQDGLEEPSNSTVIRKSRSRFSKANEAQTKEGSMEIPQGYKTVSNNSIEAKIRSQLDDAKTDYDPDFMGQVVQNVKAEEAELIQLANAEEQELAELTKEKLLDQIYIVLEQTREDFENINETGDVSKYTTKKNNRRQRITENGELEELTSQIHKSTADLGKKMNQSGGLELFPDILVFLDNDELDLDSKIDLQTKCEIFELATLIPDPETKDKSMFHAGNILYRSKEIKESGGRLRPDLVNESFYIRSLITRNYGTALNLFRSRLTKDAADVRFWYEMGIELYLIRNKRLMALELLNQVKAKFDYVSPQILGMFIDHSINNDSFDEAFKWWKELLAMAQTYGIHEDVDVLGFRILSDKDLVMEYYNRQIPVTKEDLIDAIIKFTNTFNYEFTSSVLTGVLALNSPSTDEISSALAKSTSLTKEGLYLYLIAHHKDDKSLMQFTEALDHHRETRMRDWDQFILATKLIKALEKIKGFLNYDADRQLTASVLVEQIKFGRELKSIHCKAILDLILHRGKRASLLLAVDFLAELNGNHIRKAANENTGYFPSSDSHTYIPFVQALGRKRTDKISQIEDLINTMDSLQIPRSIALVTQLALAYSKHKYYKKAINTIDSFMASKSFLSSDFSFTKFVDIYKNSLLYQPYDQKNYKYSDPLVFALRKHSLRKVLKAILSRDQEYWVPSEDFYSTAFSALIVYCDESSAICLLEYLSLQRGGIISQALFENFKRTILKHFRYILHSGELTETEKASLIQLQNSVIKMEATMDNMHWQNFTKVLSSFKEAINYKPLCEGEHKKSRLLRPESWKRSKEDFVDDVRISQEYYGLPNIPLDFLLDDKL